MKTKSLTLILSLLISSLYQTTCYSQSNIAITITTSGDDPKVCGTTQFTADILLTGNHNFSNLQFGIEHFPGVTFPGSNTTLTIAPHEYEMYSLGPVNCTTSCSLTLNFQIHYACDLFPEANVSTGQIISVIQHLVITDGPIPFSGQTNWTFQGNALADSLNYELGFYYLALQGIPGIIYSNKGSSELREIVYQNNGSIAFTGALDFLDDFACSKIALTEIKMFIRHNGTDNEIIPSPSFSVNGTEHTFSYDFTNSPVPAGDQLVLREYIDITGCLDTCNTDSKKSNFEISWGCSGSLCRTTPTFSSSILRSTDRPIISFYRILPTPSVYAPLPGGYWDQACTGSSNDIDWQFRIGNTGNANAYDVAIPIHMVDGASAYLIDYSTMQLAPCPTCTLSIAEVPTQKHIILTTEPHVKCIESMPSPISHMGYKIAQLKPGEYVTLSFTTSYCCPGLNDGTDADPLVFNLFDFLFKPFNTWHIYPGCNDECEAYSSYTSDNPPAGMFQTHYLIGQNEHLQGLQELDQNIADMTGIMDPQPACDADHPKDFQINNISINNEMLNDVLARYRNNATMFCSEYNDNPALMLMTTKIKLVFTMDAALRLFPQDATKIYIQNHNTRWNPHSFSPADACAFSGDERTYEIEFWGSELATALSLPAGLDLKHFLEFINGSFIKFSMIPCCCSANTNPDFSVKTYMEGLCESCWIPLSKVESTVHVHCPGCISPGAETIGAELKRDASSMGFEDANNDCLKDNANKINLSTYDPVAAANLRLDRSIQGDILVATVNGKFYGGAGSGLTYDTLQTRTCNAASSVCPSTSSAPYVFSHLYLDQKIPYSNTDQFNLRALTCTLTVTRAGATVQYILPSSKIDDINLNHHIGSQFLFDFTPTDIQTYGTGSFASAFAFTPGETYLARITYKVCSNYYIAEDDDTPINNKFKSEISNAFYFAVIDLPQIPFQNHIQFNDSAVAGSPGSPNFDCNKLCHSYIFCCGTFTSLHYFYSIHTRNSTGFFPYFYDAHEPNLVCKKTIIATAVSNIGGWALNIFPYEFRPAPVVTDIHVTIPSGYRVIPNSAYVETGFKTISTCYPASTNLCRKLITPSTGIYTEHIVTVDAGPGMGLNLGCDISLPVNTLIKGDESTNTQLFMHLEPLNCTNTPAITTIYPSSVQMDFETHDCDATGTVTKNINCTPSTCPNLLKPAPTLTIAPINTARASTGVFVDTIQITNPTGHFAEFAFLYFPNASNYVIENVQCISNCEVTPVQSGNFWQLGIIRTGGTKVYKISFRLLHCSGQAGDIEIPFYYGWNCLGYPTTIEDQTICDTTHSILRYQESLVTLSNTLVINNGNSSFDLCRDEKYEVTISSHDQGGVNNVHVNVNLPDYLNFGTLPAELKYGDISDISCATCTPVSVSGPTGSSFNFELNLPPSANGYLSNGHKLVLTFYLKAECGYSEDAPPEISLSYSRYCNNGNQESENLNPDWAYSGIDHCNPNCCTNFSVTPSKTDVLCHGDSLGTATATASGGTLPYSYNWNSNPQQTVSSAINLPAGTYSCTVTDDIGCTANTSVTILEPPPLELPSVTDPDVVHATSAEGIADGSITICNTCTPICDDCVSGGAPPYNYLWSNGPNTPDNFNLPTGTYTLTVTDDNLCTASAEYFIPEPHSECDAGFVTYTQGGYGNCGAPGQFLENYFDDNFPGGLEIGCSLKIRSSCYQSVRNFLPSGTKNKGPQVLNANYTEPMKPGCNFNGSCACIVNLPPCLPLVPPVYANVFAGQVMTLALNLGFDRNNGFSTNSYPFSELLYVGDGPFYGMSVIAIFKEAKEIIGGCSTTVSFSYALADLNHTVDLINKSWDNGQCPNGSCGILSCSVSRARSTPLQACCMPYNASCDNANAASILTSVHGGTPPYGYLWSTGSTDSALYDLAPGIYSVIITDSDLTSVVRFAYVYADSTMSYPAYFADSISTLNGYFTDQSNDATSGANKTWLWTFDDPASGSNDSSNLQDPVHAFSEDGLYNVCLKVQYNGNISSCSDTYCRDICIVPEASATPVSPMICAGDSILLTANVSGTNSYSYQWMLNGIDIQNTIASTFYASTPGNYTCLVTTVCSSLVTNTVALTVISVPSASISANGPVTFCTGNSVTLTALPGSGVSYQWKRNGNPIAGETSGAYVAAISGNYTCVASNMCGSGTSNAIVVTVNPILTAGISISPSATSICDGTNVTFTATPVNGGSAPIYQWKRNGVNTGTNSPTYANNSLANGDVISCVLTSNATPCLAGSPATSNAITMSVTPISPVSVSIVASASVVCQGDGVTFTATPVNGGVKPSYQWFLKGMPVGTDTNIYIRSSAVNFDSVQCIMTSNIESCTAGNPATSNFIVLSVVDPSPVSVSISASATTICSGSSVTLTATPVNGGGSPGYQWKRNGNNVGTNSATYVATNLNNGDVISCILTSSISMCAENNPATSNEITMIVNSLQQVSVSIAATAGTICAGTGVTFTATTVNGGSSPGYQWNLNGNNVGTNSSTFASSSLANGDAITCVLTSNVSPCPTGSPATSNSVTMTVNLLPDANTGSNQNACAGETISLGAAAVSGHTYSWSPSTYLSSATVSNPTFTSSTAGTTNYTMTESITSTGCQKSNGISVSVISGGGNPTFTCNSSNLVVATPITECVAPGSNDYLMMQVKITLGGGCSGAQRKLQTLKFNATSGTCSNIENAKLWYSGNSNSFTNANSVINAGTITSVSCTANNTWNAGTLQVMQPGDNYFWITYKINSAATIGQTVQASLVNVTVVANGNTTCSTFGGSTSTRIIQSTGCPGYRIDHVSDQIGLANMDVSVFPNPFTDKTTFYFTSVKDTRVLLEVFDVSGKKIATLFDDAVKADIKHEVEFNTLGISSGIYYYRLATEDEMGVGKLLIVK